MISGLFALALAATPLQDPPTVQTPPVAQVEDVRVDGRTLAESAELFVEEVGAPAHDRGLAAWQTEICVGVANLEAGAAQAVAEHVSDVAAGLGVPVGRPGCTANALIIFTDDSDAVTAGLIQQDRRAFTGALDRGNPALAAFQTSDRAVRWWYVSLTVDPATGARAYRLPGDLAQDPRASLGSNVTGPGVKVFAASHINTSVRDELNKAIVIVDTSRMGEPSFRQLGDYLAMVVLAQIDPEARTGSFDTILNLFETPGAADGLTDWDRAYLAALYGSAPPRINPGQQAQDLASALVRRARASEEASPAAD